MALRPLIALTIVGGVLFALGRTSAAVIAWMAAPIMAQAVVLSPTFVEFLESRVAPAVGRAASFVLLLPVHVFVILPASLLSRLLGTDPLALVRGDGSWLVHVEDGSRATRSFSSERHWRGPTGHRGWRGVLALLTVGVVIGLLVPWFLDRGSRDVATQLQTDDGFNAMESPAIVDEPWAAQASDEFFEAVAEGQTYTPYIGYSVRDYDSTYVNVSDRQRSSYEAADLASDASEIWFFGGSTMFGFSGQRDEHTIPSDVARLAEADETPVRVRNFGAPGYVNFQETVLLSQLLLAGGRPDVVVFYDGINDLALQLHRAFAFGETGELGDLITQGMRSELDGSLFGTDLAPAPLNPDLGFADTEAVIDGLDRTYSQGIELSETLAERYGFEVIHSWQPDLFSKTPLVEGETQLLERLGYDDFRFDALDRLSDAARERLVARGVLDLGDTYDDLDGPILNDQVHTNEAGARAVAEAIYPPVRERLDRAESTG